MSKTVDYYFSLESPWSYLGDARFKAIAARHGAEIRYRPVNYGTIFAKTGGLPVGQRAPARRPTSIGTRCSGARPGSISSTACWRDRVAEKARAEGDT